MGGHADGPCIEPGWFQSIMLRVCEGLERVCLLIDDIVCFLKNGEQHDICQGLMEFFRTTYPFQFETSANESTPRGKGSEISGSQSNA